MRNAIHITNKMLLIIAVLLLGLSQISDASAGNAITGPNIMLGVNGHPLNGDAGGAYAAVPASTQIQLVKNMGMDIYRFDTMTQSNGTVTVPYLFNPLLKAAADGNITLLVMLHPRTLDFNVSEAESYERGKTLGSNFAAKYGNVIKFYELGNELDNQLILPGQTGKSQEHFDKDKFKIVAAYLKGMDEGIKSQDKDAQTMIDAGWLHYAYLRMCEAYGIKFDILAYHWYSDMEIAAAKAPYNITDITEKLSSLFPNKPIWFTETNVQPKSTVSEAVNENAQAIFLANFITKAKKNSHVQAIVVYELLDEYHRGGKEAHYGITKWIVQGKQLANKYVANYFAAYKQ